MLFLNSGSKLCHFSHICISRALTTRCELIKSFWITKRDVHHLNVKKKVFQLDKTPFLIPLCSDIHTRFKYSEISLICCSSDKPLTSSRRDNPNYICQTHFVIANFWNFSSCLEMKYEYRSFNTKTHSRLDNKAMPTMKTFTICRQHPKAHKAVFCVCWNKEHYSAIQFEGETEALQLSQDSQPRWMSSAQFLPLPILLVFSFKLLSK